MSAQQLGLWRMLHLTCFWVSLYAVVVLQGVQVVGCRVAGSLAVRGCCVSGRTSRGVPCCWVSRSCTLLLCFRAYKSWGAVLLGLTVRGCCVSGRTSRGAPCCGVSSCTMLLCFRAYKSWGAVLLGLSQLYAVVVFQGVQVVGRRAAWSRLLPPAHLSHPLHARLLRHLGRKRPANTHGTADGMFIRAVLIPSKNNLPTQAPLPS